MGDETWGPQEEQTSLDTLRAAIDAGITLFDTAEMYGNGYSETLLGKVLPPVRDKVVIASKVHRPELTADQVFDACHQSLTRLKTDYLDLFQIHWPCRTVPLEETYRALDQLRKQGKIRAIGICNFGPKDLADYVQIGDCVSNQISYSMLFRAAEFEIQPLCSKHNISILPYSPLMQGLLTGKFTSADQVPEGRARTRLFASARPRARHSEKGCEGETFELISKIQKVCDSLQQPMADVALAWLLSRDAVSSLIAGARNPQQVHENARAADLVLSKDTLNQLTALTEPVKSILGPNPDMWQTESRYR